LGFNTLASMAPIKYWLLRNLWDSLDWLFPPNCGGCDRFGVKWCDECRSSVVKLDTNVCTICGKPQPYPQVCPECVAQAPYYDATVSWALYRGPLRTAIHRLKYGGDLGLGEYFSRMLIEKLCMVPWLLDLVLPVPMSSSHAAQRGYNQADLLARPVAYNLNLPYKPGLIKKARENRSQVGLTRIEREENVKDAFEVTERIYRNQRVLVIDDIMTTGSTLNSCAKALKEAGAAAVYGLTLARAALTSHVDFMIR
jgi:competence protein ComFC